MTLKYKMFKENKNFKKYKLYCVHITKLLEIIDSTIIIALKMNNSLELENQQVVRVDTRSDKKSCRPSNSISEAI